MRFIAIAGNIGAGKTELTQFLCRRYDIKPFYEIGRASCRERVYVLV